MDRKVSVIEDIDGKNTVFIHDIILKVDKKLSGMKLRNI